MRAVKILVALVLIWSVVWGFAAFGLRTAFTGWFAERAEEGWQAEFASANSGGYPARHRTVLQMPALADPGTGTAWRADWIGFESPAIWPGRQSVQFADTPQFLSYYDATQTLTAADMVADLDLSPGLALQVKRLGLTSARWQVAQDESPALTGAGLSLTMEQQDSPDLYNLDVSIPDFTPGESLRRIMGGADSLPESFDSLQLDAKIRFDRPWDRRALEDQRPQPVRIDLRLAEAAWGPLRLSLSGEVDVTDGGIPDGKVTLRAENWRDMLRMAKSAGALSEPVAQSAERALGFLAGLGGRPDTLDVQLNLSGGYIAVGPVPIGPAPRLILR